MDWFKSRTVAAQLGVTYWTLFNLLRNRQIDPPAKDDSGDFIWMPDDVERARRAIQARRDRRKAVSA